MPLALELPRRLYSADAVFPGQTAFVRSPSVHLFSGFFPDFSGSILVLAISITSSTSPVDNKTLAASRNCPVINKISIASETLFPSINAATIGDTI